MKARDWNVRVVEDDPDGQDVVQRILRHHRIGFEAAYDAETALDMLDKGHYTLAVIDLALPGIDGWELLKAIRSDPQTAAMPCVAITAYHSSEVILEAGRNGFAAYFAKPLDATS